MFVLNRFNSISVWSLITFLWLPSQTWAHKRTTTPQVNCEAELVGEWIRFDNKRVMPGGWFKGKSLSLGSPAPALIALNRNQISFFSEEPPADSWIAGNFLTRSGIAVAYVPNTAPDEVSLLRELETDGVYHLMIRFVFPENRKIKFMSQHQKAIQDKPKEVADIVLDFGTHCTKGDEATADSMVRGAVGLYALQSRMSTTWFKLRRIQKAGRPVTEFKLDLNEEQKLELAQRFFKRTREINQGEMYNSFAKNCATELVTLFKGLEPNNLGSQSRLQKITRSAVQWTPSGFLWSLRARGIIVGNSSADIQVSPQDQL